MAIANWRTFILQLAVGVVLQDVVCDELDRVVGASPAYLRQCLHDSGRDSLLQVSFSWQVVDADGSLFGHGSHLGLTADFRVDVATLGI